MQKVGSVVNGDFPITVQMVLVGLTIDLRQGSTPTIKMSDNVAFSTHGLPIMHIIT